MYVCVFLRHRNESDNPAIIKYGFPTMKENEFFKSTNFAWLFFNNHVVNSHVVKVHLFLYCLWPLSVLSTYAGTGVPSWSTIERIEKWNWNVKTQKNSNLEKDKLHLSRNMKVLQVYDMIRREHIRKICKMLSKYKKNLAKEHTACLFKTTNCFCWHKNAFEQGTCGT